MTGDDGTASREDPFPPRPGDAASRAPEPPWSEVSAPVEALGIGPGGSEYLTAGAKDAIRSADVVVGFDSVVDHVRPLTTGEVLACDYTDESETLSRFAHRVAGGDVGVAVLMGDPNFSGYQFVGKLEALLDRPVRVQPGVSSLQVGAARARTPMEDTTFVTLHKSGPVDTDLARIRKTAGKRHLLVLPRPFDLMPQDIAADLIDHGTPAGLETLVLERLTHPSERISRMTLGELATAAGGDSAESTTFSDLSVLAVRSSDTS